jgi:membrane protease YdiL (CAAX protease family)
MTRRPLFWLLLAALALAGGAFAALYYDESFPLLSVELRMARGEALDSAAALARSIGTEPAQFSEAASFGQTDPEVQTYVELEGGGPEAFAQLVAGGPYRPYAWQVRHFAEGEVAETWFRFTPEGAPYGFRQTLAEDEPRPSLPADAARALAEEEARTRWGVELSAYQPLESSQEVRPGGRTDHTFVYERVDAGLGEAKTRLRLGVAGDRPSEVTHFVHVPEAFLRRYQEMRSANEALALVSNLIFLVGFLLVAGGVGTFFLLRRGWVIWRAPLAWGVVVSVLTAAGLLNQLPLAWMGYDTAVSRGTFILQQVGTAIVVVVLGTPFLAFVFLSAESLTRRAFPKQPQQWRLWSRGVANSDAVLGRTAGAYLWAAVDLGFVVLFYLVVSRLPGWWIPSETLVDPNLLATPFPWLAAFSLAVFAGFWEESLFRAVPLAAAKLLGDRYGRTWAWVGAALVIQAVVFAAGHANYPQQPSYARIAELLTPALLWGVFYLYFGLLPVILIHFLHNFVLSSVVLFSASDSGLLLDRALSIALMSTPLAIVLVARVRWGRVRELPASASNAGWQPTPRTPPREEPETLPRAGVPVEGGPPIAVAGGGVGRAAEVEVRAAPRRAPLPLGVAGVAGAALLALFADRGADAPPLPIDRGEAIATARAALEGRGVEVDDWEAVAAVEGSPSASARFVREEVGEEAYRALLGSYLAPPQWRVRFVRFTGPVEERVEEWQALVGPDGGVRGVAHQLPEVRPGPALAEDAARLLARVALGVEALDATGLREISAEARQRPARRDWLFTYASDQGPELEGGELRVEVEVAGDEVVGLRRYVHVPETWEREERSRATRLLIGRLGSVGLSVLLLLTGVVVAVVVWSRGAFAVKAAAAAATALVVLQVAGAVNGVPAALASFTTAEPLRTQIVELAVGLLLASVAVAGGFGLLTGLAHTWLRGVGGGAWRPAVGVGVAAGLALAGGRAVWARAFPSGGGPEWPSYEAAGTYLPVLQPIVQALTALVAAGAALLLVVAVVERWTAGWTRRRTDAVVTLLWLGLVLSGAAADMRGTLAADLTRWAAGGVAVGAALLGVYHLARRFGAAPIPVLVAVLLAATQLEVALVRPFDGAPAAAAGATLLVALGAAAWSRALQRAR